MKKLTTIITYILIAALVFSACGQEKQAEQPELPEQSEQNEETEETGDKTAPLISGVSDFAVYVGDSVAYREGVTVTDDTDEYVELVIDADEVDLDTPGTYMVMYSAVDSSGNKAVEIAFVTVDEPPVPEEDPEEEQTEEGETEEGTSENESDPPASGAEVTMDDVNKLCDKVLAKIIKPGMSKTEQAKAILKYVYGHIKYIGTSDKSNWVNGAYVGFTKGKGDCFNYYACSKALLTRIGVDNIDLRRVGGKTKHFWNLVYLNGQWYHFDACWGPTGYNHPHGGFMMTEAEVRNYTQKTMKVRPNYYVYDYASLSVLVADTPTSAYGDYTKLIERGIVAVDENGNGYIPENKPEEPVTPPAEPENNTEETPSEEPVTPPQEPENNTEETPSEEPVTPPQQPENNTEETPSEEPVTPPQEPENNTEETPAEEPVTPPQEPENTTEEEPVTPPEQPQENSTPEENGTASEPSQEEEQTNNTPEAPQQENGTSQEETPANSTDTTPQPPQSNEGGNTDNGTQN